MSRRPAVPAAHPAAGGALGGQGARPHDAHLRKGGPGTEDSSSCRVCVFLCVSVYGYMRRCVSVCVCVCGYVWLCVSVCGFVCLSVATCICLCLSVALCGYVSLCVFLCLVYALVHVHIPGVGHLPASCTSSWSAMQGAHAAWAQCCMWLRSLLPYLVLSRRQ